jgi:hypothetical protein
MHRCFIALVCLGTAACGGGINYGEHPPYPTSGKVLVNGEPVKKAKVTLYHEEDWGGRPIVPTGTTDADGRFVLETYGLNDGAPAGHYRVTIVWPVSPHKGFGLGPDQLGGKYNKRDSSELTVTIEKKTNILAPFKLTVDLERIAAANEEENAPPRTGKKGK